MTRVQLAWLTSLTGYFILFFTLLASIAVMPEEAPRLFFLLVLVGPLLFPLRGLLHGKPYTHAWSGFMALFYLVIAIGVAAGKENFLVGSLEAFAAMLWFFGSLFYVRWKLPKK